MKRSWKIFVAATVLLFSLSAFIDDDPIKELTAKLNLFNSVFPQHKLALTFNQPEYAPGDTVFFKAHLLDENLKPVEGKQIVSMVLIDTEGAVIKRESFSIRNGIAGNQLVLPPDLSGGVYEMVAYTNWMKNFSSRLYFSGLLTVVTEHHMVFRPSELLDVQLHAEGGNIIAGIPLRLVAAARRGRVPVQAEGRIVDAQGNELIKFNCDKTGLANFEIVFLADTEYLLEVPGLGKTPIAIEAEGNVLKVQKEGGLLKTTIWNQSRKPIKESVYIIATSRSKVRYASMISLNEENKTTSVLIPYQNIPPGILQIYLFDSRLNQLASRLVFVEGDDTPEVKIRLNEKQVATRSEISFEIAMVDEKGTKVQADVLVSGVFNNLFPRSSRIDFREQLLIGSDVPDATYILKEIDINTQDGADGLDAFLITREWERFRWDEVLDNKKKQPAYHPQDILILEGEASFAYNDKPVPDSTQVLFFLQQNIFGYEVNTGKDGKMSWPVYFDFYDDENVMYSMESRGKTLMNTTIKLYRDTFPNVRAPRVELTDQKNPYYNFRTIAQVSNTSYTYGWNKETVDENNRNPNAEIEEELNGADFTIKVDDYVVFPTIEDLFREVVRFVQNRKIGGKQTLRVLSTDSNNPMTGDPLYVVDGIATKNTDYILSMNPGDIEVIKVINDVKKLRNLGGITKNGVVFFQTKVANMGAQIPKDDILNIRGLNKPLPYHVMPRLAADRTPYLKSTIYWNPQLPFNESNLISDTFYTADNTGIISLRMQGVTVEGIPFDKEELIEVVFRPE